MSLNTRFATLMLALATVILASANPINENQAQSVASRFMAGKSMQRVALQRANKAPGQAHAAYYVFNAQANQGYVIVSGDDRVPPILGYSDNGTFDPTDVPEAMQYLLDGYAAQIAELPDAMPAPQQVSRTPVAPLMTSIWGQGNPFNNNLPYVRTTTTSSGETRALHAVTGCVATAMAQIMYYHKWPESSTQTIPAYTSSTTVDGKTLTFQRPALEPATFDWANMKNSYNSTDSTNASGKAVARLMEYCDQALEMQFEENQSTAYTSHINQALSFYFDYDAGMRYVIRSSFSTTEWEDLLYAELQAKRPVAYCGNKNPGGHAFVCDGCDANGLFHINWGWNSASDGYFLLRDLNPSAQGTGSASGNCGYINDQGMVIGIKPNAGGQSTFSIAFRDLIYNTGVTSLNRASSNDDFKISVKGGYQNNSSYDVAFDYGWGLYQGETFIKPVATQSRSNPLRIYYYLEATIEIPFGKDLSNGNYTLRPIYSELGKNQWKMCEGGKTHYLTANINGNECNMDIFGSVVMADYTINNVTFAGTMNAGKQVTMTANMTNKGNNDNDFIYLFVDGVKTSSAMADMPKGQSADIVFHFIPQTAGTHTVTLSISEDGGNPMLTREITINQMPAATLNTTNELLYVTDASNKVITSRTFGVKTTFANTGSTNYNEDVVLKLYRVNDGTNYGNLAQEVILPLQLNAGESKTLQFDATNVYNGEMYFVWVYYYSEGKQVRGSGSSTYTLVFPADPETKKGDLNGDGKVDVSDVNIIINVMLGKNQDPDTKAKADVTGDGKVDVSDVNAVINIMLGK